MLDFTTIPVVDNHCHPVLLKQQMDVAEFRRYFTESPDASIAEQHVPHTIYYLWMLRQLAAFYECERSEDAVVAARSSMSAEYLMQRLITSAHIDTLVLDPAYPLPDVCYSPEQISQIGHCKTASMFRLETQMQRLVIAHHDFDDVLFRFSAELADIRARGYCTLKSIVAYRTGLQIAVWSKDEAARSFQQARADVVQQQQQFRIAHKPLIDYLLHIAFAHAAEQHVPIQFHTGYGDNDTDMRLGNPLQLRDVLERRDYQTMPIVLLHESYPYTQLGAYLAAVYPHVYFDLSYTIPFVEKLEMLAFTRQALSIAPASKLMYSSDGINIPEMHWAGAMRGRRVIAQVLQEMIDADELDEQQAFSIAQHILHDNAYKVYQL
ncbi:MAG: amidohydrolase family protein [Ktedonobacteraceae bacterium]